MAVGGWPFRSFITNLRSHPTSRSVTIMVVKTLLSLLDNRFCNSFLVFWSGIHQATPEGDFLRVWRLAVGSHLNECHALLKGCSHIFVLGTNVI